LPGEQLFKKPLIDITNLLRHFRTIDEFREVRDLPYMRHLVKVETLGKIEPMPRKDGFRNEALSGLRFRGW
jgi:hypothetical protein